VRNGLMPTCKEDSHTDVVDAAAAVAAAGTAADGASGTSSAAAAPEDEPYEFDVSLTMVTAVERSDRETGNMAGPLDTLANKGDTALACLSHACMRHRVFCHITTCY
jgi:hypothetical protein